MKEALQSARASNPDDHAMRDFYERRLLDLVEKQKHSPAKKLLVKAKKDTVADKDKKSEETKAPVTKPNIALRIIGQAQELLNDYFENTEFIEKLKSHSSQTKVQLGLLDELTQLATDLSIEAT